MIKKLEKLTPGYRISEIRSCLVITPRAVFPSTTSTAWFCWRILITVSTSMSGGTVGNPDSMKSLTVNRWVLCRRCCSMAFTITASEMQPTGIPRSITGSWEILFFSKMSTARDDRILRLHRKDGCMHDLGCLDLLWFRTVQHDNDLI